MKRLSVTGIATATAAGLGLALTGATLRANPPDQSFGPVVFHQAPTERRISVNPEQIRLHPGEPFAVWSGYSTYPEYTPGQRRMLEDALNSAKGGNKGGSHGGGTPSPSPTPTPSGAPTTIPHWEAAITSPTDGKTYSYAMAGSSPYDAPPAATTITYVPIVLRVTISGVTYDPTQPACDDTVSVQNRFFDSPLFGHADYTDFGLPIAGEQFASAFQIANFWDTVYDSGSGSYSYGVDLTPSVAPPHIVDVSLKGRNYNLTCKANGNKIHLGAVDINKFDSAIQSAIAKVGVTPDQLPIVLTYNIVESSYGQCCVLGYHNAVPVSGGVLTYATGAYIDNGVFTDVNDVAIWSHEIGEWLDDPFVQISDIGGGTLGLTPSWGNIGQVSGCQNNLEVGDPLTGTQVPMNFAGFTYHLQDLAYKDWFYRTPPGTPNNDYSFFGTFTAADLQAVC